MIADLLTFAFLLQILRITVPYALAALGGVFSERSGVIDLCLEGKLLAGAFMAAVGAEVGGPVTGFAAGLLGGLLVAALYDVVVVRLRADQIVSGIAINLLVLGLTRFGLKLIFGSASSSGTVDGFTDGRAAWVFVAFVIALTVGAHTLLTRTPEGLRVRAVGDHPAAAASLGVDVGRVRWAAVLVSGALAGAGGAWLALDVSQFNDGMSAGRGYIALAAVIFGRWRPVGAVLACLLLGFADAMQLHLQTRGTGIPREFVQILPYVLTMIVLPSLVGRSRAPAAIGRPFA